MWTAQIELLQLKEKDLICFQRRIWKRGIQLLPFILMPKQKNCAASSFRDNLINK